MDTYRTIARQSESLYKEKMSKFISFAFPVATAAEAKEVVAMVRNQYHDARHVCWAYMVGPERTASLSSDDGEPSGTAGKPILGQINSFELTDIVVVVVRYFGGIKLGTSGLIAAYRQAARQALDEAEIVERHQMCRLEVEFSYMEMNAVMRAVKQSGAKVLSQNFDNVCRLAVEIRKDDADQLAEKFANIGRLID